MIQKYQLEIKNAYGIRKNKHLIERRRKFVKDDDDDVRFILQRKLLKMSFKQNAHKLWTKNHHV